MASVRFTEASPPFLKGGRPLGRTKQPFRRRDSPPKRRKSFNVNARRNTSAKSKPATGGADSVMF